MIHMSKVINGKKYDTGTAHKLIRAEVQYATNGLAFAWDTLYRKRTGEYFLFKSNEVKETVEIEPLTPSEAIAWAEKNLDAEEYETVFGDIEEDSGNETELNQQISVLLPISLYEALKAKKSSTGMNISALIIKTLRDAGYGKESKI